MSLEQDIEKKIEGKIKRLVQAHEDRPPLGLGVFWLGFFFLFLPVIIITPLIVFWVFFSLFFWLIFPLTILGSLIVFFTRRERTNLALISLVLMTFFGALFFFPFLFDAFLISVLIIFLIVVMINAGYIYKTSKKKQQVPFSRTIGE